MNGLLKLKNFLKSCFASASAPHKDNPKAWLTEKFCHVATKKISEDKYKARLPFIFTLEVTQTPHKIYLKNKRKHIYMPPEGIVHEVFALGRTEKESVKALSTKIIKLLKKNEDIARAVLKKGQSLINVDLNKPKKIVHNNDPEHDHASLELLDFEYLRLNTRTMKTEVRDFHWFHSHLHIG